MSAQLASPEQHFVSPRRELLVSVLDRIVPREGDYPGAGELGVVEYLESAASRSAGSAAILDRGLARIEAADGSFAELSDGDQDRVLERVERDDPGFFAELVRHAYTGYYTDPRITELLGPDVRPPQPLGYPLEAGDLSLLENVRKRGPIYRKV